jgi:hypothetical protein
MNPNIALVTAHMQIRMIGAPISEAVNQPGITVIGEHDRLVGGEQLFEVAIGQTMRMLARLLQLHQIDNRKKKASALELNYTSGLPRASLGRSPAMPIALRMTKFLAGKTRSASPSPRLRKNLIGNRSLLNIR